MRRLLATVLSALAVGLPFAVDGVAVARAAVHAKAVKSTTRKVSGTPGQAGQWGSVRINVTVKTTVKGSHKTVRYTDLGGSYSYHTSRSQFIMSQSLPMLRQEFLAAQSANIQMVSGATLTSEAFISSLQSALLKAK
jgi:uncharacterized protein with FMN-binding domain